MFSPIGVQPTIPAKNMERARKFYSEKLGFEPAFEIPEGLVYRCNQTTFLLYPSIYAGTAKHTIAEWVTENIEEDVQELSERGVIFEEYNLPELKTNHGIAAFGENKAAWFKDSEGNILSIAQISGFEQRK